MTAEWQSGYNSMGAPNAIKEIEDVYITGRGQTIGFDVMTERKSKVKEIPLTTTMGVKHKPFINFGRLFKILITVGEPHDFEISSIRLVIDIDMD